MMAPVPVLGGAIWAAVAAAAAATPSPVIHFTPPCYDHKAGWHDTAGALLHPITREWHIFVGPVWQHLSTANLVDWTVVGIQQGMGGSGTLIYDHDRNLTVAVTGTVSAFTTASQNLLNFTPAGELFKTTDPNVVTGKIGCWDPVLWWDERVHQYFAMGACGHNNDPPHPAGGTGMGGTGGFGLQQYFRSPAISGAAAKWEEIATPFLEWHTESVPRVGDWNRTVTTQAICHLLPQTKKHKARPRPRALSNLPSAYGLGVCS